MNTGQNIFIRKEDPAIPAARQMMALLWEEIQLRYGFVAPNPMQPSGFNIAGAGFWIAWLAEQAVGSIAIVPLADQQAELDAMYVVPAFRGKGIAQQLMLAAEQHARANNNKTILLRAGAPQPEALRFYEKMGFSQIPCFGKWTDDPTAICLRKKLSA